MKRLAVYIIVLAMLGIAGCPCIDPPPPKAAARIARCASPEACGPQQTCDPITQACVDVCDKACAVDQVRVQTASGACTCANTDGLGSPCLTDGDCASVSGSPSVRQLCRSIASPEPGWPATSVCVEEPSCTVGTSECGDPDLSAQIEATCVGVVRNPPGPGTCTTTCVDTSGTMRTNCRIDQIPTVATDGTCTCASRRDPFGDACAVDADCAWVAGVFGNAGPTRVCKLLGSKRTCVPTDFCLKEEIKTTCHNGVDDDCDGTADGDEPACTVNQCADRDSDGYCDSSSCSVRKPIVAQNDRPESECRNREQAVCDAPGMGTRNPGVLEVCNGIDDNCDINLTVDENCPSPCVPSTEVCDGRDNDCNGVADDIPTESCNTPAVGECARGHVVCNGSNRECVPALPQHEVCGDGRDNDCDGRVDVNTTRDEVITDITVPVAGGAVGTSVNYVLGEADCGGERLSASFVRTSGDGDCWVFGWANDACRANPDATAGHSTIREACQRFWQQGGDHGTRDCRYIAHSGNAWWTTGTCQGSFRKRVPACR